MTDEIEKQPDEIDALMATKGENRPAMEQVHVPPDDQMQRREILARLLQTGRSDDEIITVMSAKFGLNRAGVRRLEEEVFASWQEQSRRRKPHEKHAQHMRLLSHIREAIQDRDYKAVANLEKVVATILGHNEPQEIQIRSNMRQVEALEQLLGEAYRENPKGFRRLVDAELKRFEESKLRTIDILPEQQNQNETKNFEQQPAPRLPEKKP